MQSATPITVILGTGGTIAGTAARPDDSVGYQAATLGIEALLAAVPPLAGLTLEAEQVAQLDSKDMDATTWQALLAALDRHLARPEVQGVVITHGTDTLEETAYLLHRMLAPAKPVVLTAAMRPATSLQPDGPQNLLDAVGVARTPGARGVLVVVAGDVHDAPGLRKARSHRVDAFEAGEAGRLGVIADGQVSCFRPWPAGSTLGASLKQRPAEDWPCVALLTSHAGTDGRLVEALPGLGVRGLVMATTGNGTLHRQVLDALERIQGDGLRMLRASRCAQGGIVGAGGAADRWPSAGALTPVQARIELMLQIADDDARVG